MFQLTILININISPIKFNDKGKEKFIIQNKNYHIITIGKFLTIPLFKNNNRLPDRS